MRKYINIFIITLLLWPAVSSAQLTGIKDLIIATGGIVNMLIVLSVGIALFGFFWGLVKFIFAQGSEIPKLEAKKIMGWGLIALFVMISVWGIIGFAQDALSLRPAGYTNQHLPPTSNPLNTQ